jgi:hypothetical protein
MISGIGALQDEINPLFRPYPHKPLDRGKAMSFGAGPAADRAELRLR